MKYILFILSLFMITSCGKFKDGTSVWAEGLWAIPLLLVLGGIWFLYLTIRASKSNSTQQIRGVGTIDNTGNVPIYKIGKFYISMALFVAAAVVIIIQNAEK